MYPRHTLKARTQGKGVKDRWLNKRSLFKPNLAPTKYGIIGTFWEKPKATLRQSIKEQEQRLDEGLDRAGVKRLAKHVHDF
jgi:hypothetical protein